jgi:integrase
LFSTITARRTLTYKSTGNILSAFPVPHQRHKTTGEDWYTFNPAFPPAQKRSSGTLFTRHSYIAEAKFEDFKEDGVWKCVQAKTGMKLRISLGLRLDVIGLSIEDVVKQCRDRYVSKHLIHYTRNAQGVRPGDQVDPKRLSKAFKEARDKAGIKPADGKTPPTFHEIRSLSERLYEKQYDGKFTQKLLGHKSAKMTAVYHDSRGSEWIEVAAG